MKLPKNFGGQGFAGALQQAQQAMARAQNLEQELAAERVTVDKGPVKAVFIGTGEIESLKIDPSVVDPEDVEALEDLILGAVRDGFTKTSELRNSRVQELMPNIPGMDKLIR
ncbi:MAG: YbaB/EbfC family nucleoid-associated protein [Fimbriimonadaceae bacterium]|nr:YbaB/EbfC family nucleoid-associated protein [Fimbriimonadaceae bacterium]QYK58780.1 MAG: YbaB/EbfC family nucleoid-associated protein [Fimbriimonadaceae bacterium]